MNYFVTGGTGFVGRFLLEKLLNRGGHVYVLTRPASMHKIGQLKQKIGATQGQLIPVAGDLTAANLGLSDADSAALAGKIDHFFHVAAVYDLKADEASQAAANIDGTRHALECASALQARCFQHISSVSVSGLYPGTFREDMFEEAENLVNAYFRTKHESEAVVRAECRVPYRIYRPSGIVGHSKTGEIDKIDGPYYSFPVVRRLGSLPRWLPLPGVAAGGMNLVPVDYVVDALDHIAHQPDLDGDCFHLVNPKQYDVTELTNLFARVAGGATLSETKKLDPAEGLFKKLLSVGLVQRAGHKLFALMNIPADVLTIVQWDTRYDASATERALAGSGITVPDLNDYAGTLWQYWDHHLRTRH